MIGKIFGGYLLILLVAVFTDANAQMQPAHKVTLYIDTTNGLPVKRSVVWNLVKDPANWNKFLGESVTSFATTGVTGDGSAEPTMEIKMRFIGGPERKLKVKQFQPEYRFILLKVSDPIPAGITENFIGITVDVETESSCKLAYRVKVDGPAQAKEELLAQLKTEKKIFLEGINKNIVPAAK